MTRLGPGTVNIQTFDSVKSSVKLVVWDLDETFWNGTLSEEGIAPIQAHIDMVRTLVDRGIMCSICSKNDFDQAREALEKLGIWDLFVFPHIAWSPKGQAIEKMIKDMGLRDENVLFLDDNHLNLEEAQFFNKGLMAVAAHGDMTGLLALPQLKGKDDRDHTRLAQYRVMAQKQTEQADAGLSNIDFLRQSNIQLRIISDVENHMDRVLEILNRTNQLNFTKVRANTEDEQQALTELLSATGMHAGLIEVRDRYGDYGIVGFFCVRLRYSGTSVVHFAFSCRTLNMGVEQWVWNHLGRPDIAVVDPVASQLDDPGDVDWITEVSDFAGPAQKKPDPRFCLVGGCDLQQVSFYCSANRDEFVNTQDADGMLVRYDDVGFFINPRDRYLEKSTALNQFAGYTLDDMLRLDQSLAAADQILLSLFFASGGDNLFTFGSRTEAHKYWCSIPPGRLQALMRDPKTALVFAKTMVHRRLSLEDRMALTRAAFEHAARLRKPGVPLFILGATTDHGPQAERSQATRQAFNAMCRDFCAATPGAIFIDTNLLLEPDQFNDSDHFTRTGYYAIADFVNTQVNDMPTRAAPADDGTPVAADAVLAPIPDMPAIAAQAAPETIPTAPPALVTQKARTLIVTTKNEGPFLLEWIMYHRLIGFTDIIVFANDCTDGSDHLLALLDDAGLIRYFDNSQQMAGFPPDPQNRAYQRAFQMEEVRASEWLLVIDADEFFNIHVGDGTLDALLTATGSCDAISPQWCVFGNSGRVAYTDDFVTTQFDRSAPKDVQVSFPHFGIKTMFRPGHATRLGIHRPFLEDASKQPDAPFMWLNGSGKDVTEAYREKGWSARPATSGYDLCQINHYMIKSNELFLMKRYRGTANTTEAERINFDYYDSFNSNHTTETTIQRWENPLRDAVEKLRADHPAIAVAHDHCVRFFEDKISTLRQDLQDSDPEISAKLLSAEAAAKSIATDEAWLETAKTQKRKPRPAPDPTPEPAAVDPDDAAPQWLADLRRSDHRCGFYHSDVSFAAQYAERTTDTLIVSFDNLSNVKDPALSRESWGYDFYKAEGWSHLGIMSFVVNWYRDDALFDYLSDLAANGFFDAFDKVVLTGTSMGAYAATAFSGLIPGAVVLAFSPQSTLDTGLVPWEERFGVGRKQDWSGRFRDGADEITDAAAVFVLYDPMFEPDRLHADRYVGPQVHHLKTWFSGHKSALFLKRAKILKAIVRAAVAGELDEAHFYKLYRARRTLPWYINGLADQAQARGHLQLVDTMAQAVIRDGRVNLGKAVQARMARSAGN